MGAFVFVLDLFFYFFYYTLPGGSANNTFSVLNTHILHCIYVLELTYTFTRGLERRKKMVLINVCWGIQQTLPLDVWPFSISLESSDFFLFRLDCHLVLDVYIHRLLPYWHGSPLLVFVLVEKAFRELCMFLGVPSLTSSGNYF